MISRSTLCVLVLACGLTALNAQTIVNTVVDSTNHTMLETLVTNAGLVDTLSSTARSFTLFAPTDAAFTALGTNTLVSKLTSNEARWMPLLGETLKYHVLEVNSSVLAAALPTTAADFKTLATAMDSTAVLTVVDQAPQVTAKAPGVNAGTVGLADVTSGNGVVHVIDQVLLPPATQRSVVGVATGNNATFSTLVELLTLADLVTTLETDDVTTAFTVFAPTNAAFAALNPGIVECLKKPENKATLAELLRFHVVTDTVMSSALTDGATITTLKSSGVQTLTYTAAGMTLTASNTATISSAQDTIDVLASNGVVHVIDAVLIPSDLMCQYSVVDVVVGAPALSTLETLVTAADLAPTLSSYDRAFTVFGPNDAAFTALQTADANLHAKLASGETMWKPLLQETLKHHVLSANTTVLASGLPAAATDFATLATAMDMEAMLTIINTGTQFTSKAPGSGAATATTTDVTANNGVVHIVDQVLLPPATQRDVVDIATSGGFSTLVSLVTTADLATVLTMDDVATAYTVFAPTNAAFAKLPAETVTCLTNNPPLLAELLKFHVVSGTVMSSSLTDGQTITPMSMWFADNEFTFTAANLTLTPTGTGGAAVELNNTLLDILGSNGVVHAINSVLIPPGFACPASVVDIVVGSAAHAILETLVLAVPDVQTALSAQPADLTLFAPTDTAFAALPAAMTTKLTGADAAKWGSLLAAILTFHAVPARLPSSALTATATDVATVNTAEITLVNAAPQVSAKAPGEGSATADPVDLMALNGIVHVIDAVLLPPEATRTVVDVVADSADHSTLETLLTSANLLDTVRAAGATDMFTVFAPTNAAFTALGDATLTCLQAAGNEALLADVLRYHVAADVIMAAGLPANVPTLATSFTTNSIPVDSISAVTADILAVNGVVHSVDAVLVPAGFECPTPGDGNVDVTTPAPGDSAAGRAAASSSALLALLALASAALLQLVSA